MQRGAPGNAFIQGERVFWRDSPQRHGTVVRKVGPRPGESSSKLCYEVMCEDGTLVMESYKHLRVRGELRKREVKKTAYLLGIIDIKADPPKFVGASIFSEKYPTLGAKWSFVIMESTEDTFKEAINEISLAIETIPAYSWLKRYAPNNGELGSGN